MLSRVESVAVSVSALQARTSERWNRSVKEERYCLARNPAHDSNAKIPALVGPRILQRVVKY